MPLVSKACLGYETIEQRRNECSRSSAKMKDSKVDRYRACDGTDVDQPLSKVFANYANTRAFSVVCLRIKT